MESELEDWEPMRDRRTESAKKGIHNLTQVFLCYVSFIIRGGIVLQSGDCISAFNHRSATLHIYIMCSIPWVGLTNVSVADFQCQFGSRVNTLTVRS